MKCLELQNPNTLTAEQILVLRNNLEERENHIQRLSREVLELNQEISNSRGKNDRLINQKIPTIKRRLDVVCDQVIQFRSTLYNRDETIIHLNNELELMRNHIHDIPRGQDLTSTMTILNNVDDDVHIARDIPSINPQGQDVILFLDNSLFSFFNSYMISMADRSEEMLFERTPKISDMFQGTIGDCYFLSALSAVVQYIQSIVVDNGYGTVTGRLFDDGNNACYIVSERVYQLMLALMSIYG